MGKIGPSGRTNVSCRTPSHLSHTNISYLLSPSLDCILSHINVYSYESRSLATYDRADEHQYIVYDEAQTQIKYLLKLKWH